MWAFPLSALDQRNSVRPWQRTEDFWNNLLLNTPQNSPLPFAENYEQWAALTFLRTAKWGGASAAVLGQWRTE